MIRNKYYHYFVEGENEEKIVNILKTELQWIVPGKVQKFNVIEKLLTKNRLLTLNCGTIVILVFDTDTGKSDILRQNIALLKKHKSVKDIYCITQVDNLEDELVRSCTIKEIKELTDSDSNSDFKRDMLKDTKLKNKLLKCNFDFEKFWNSVPPKKYQGINNDAKKIKK